MNIPPPTHRRVPWDAGSRLDGRPLGDAHPRASGRKPDISPPRLPVARVHSRRRLWNARLRAQPYACRRELMVGVR